MASTESKRKHDTITLLKNREVVIVMPGKENLGESIEYIENGEKMFATAEKHVHIPVEMNREKMKEWIETQLEDKESYLHRTIEKVRDE